MFRKLISKSAIGHHPLPFPADYHARNAPSHSYPPMQQPHFQVDIIKIRFAIKLCMHLCLNHLNHMLILLFSHYWKWLLSVTTFISAL